MNSPAALPLGQYPRSKLFSDPCRVPPTALVLLALLVYTGLYFVYLHNPGNSVKSDSLGYLRLANNLRHHQVFSSNDNPPFSPELFRLPGYPLFLALLNAVSPTSISWAIGLQCLMGIGLLFLIWPFFYRWGGRIGAMLGSIFLCFDLVSVLHQNLIMTEALFTFALTGALYLSTRYFESPKLAPAIPAGLAWGVAALIKPIALITAGAFLLASFKTWKISCLVALCTLILPLSWVIRNWTLTGRPVYTVQGGLALFQYPAAGALAIDTGCSREEALQTLEETLRKEGFDKTQDPLSQNLTYQRKAIEVMKQHPFATLQYCLAGTIRILGGTGLDMLMDLRGQSNRPVIQKGSDTAITGAGTLNLLREHPGFIGVAIAYELFLAAGYLLFAAGAWKLARRGEAPLARFIVLAVLALLLISCHQGYYRFRIPLLPFLALGIAACFQPSEDH